MSVRLFRNHRNTTWPNYFSIKKTLHQTEAEYTFFSRVPRTLNKIDHFWAIKQVSIKFEKFQSIFSGCNGNELEINNKKLFGKSPNIWELNNIFLNNLWIREEIKREIGMYSEPTVMPPWMCPILFDLRS